MDLRVAGFLAADEVERDADAVLPAADDLRVAAGFADDDLRDVEADDDLADDALRDVDVAGLEADDLRDVEAAGFAADDLRDVDVAGLEAADDDRDPRIADGRDAVGGEDSEAVVPAVAPVDPRRANGLVADGRRELADDPPRGLTSSAAMRFVSPSMSLRSPFSSSTTRSSSTSRIRFAAEVTSFARPRVDLAPSADAVKVRSTAARTASTASAAPAVAWSFLLRFLESFLDITGRS